MPSGPDPPLAPGSRRAFVRAGDGRRRVREGRVDEIIELGDGTCVYPTEVWRIFRGRPGILRYQLVQHDRDRFELRVVGDGSDASAQAVVDVVAALRTLLRGAPVEPNWVAELPSGPGNKFQHLVPLSRSAASGLAV